MRAVPVVLLAVVALLMLLPPIGTNGTTTARSPLASNQLSDGPRVTGSPTVVLVVPFTVTNNQTSATGYYQQMVRINSARWSPFLNSNLSNMNFTYASNGTSVSSWIETNDSNTSTDTIVWIDLASIPGPGTVKLFLDIYNEGAFLWSENGQSGIAPELSSSYAKFDNGWRVFPYYWNWSGHVTPAGWTFFAGGTGSSAVVSNGLNLTNVDTAPGTLQFRHSTVAITGLTWSARYSVGLHTSLNGFGILIMPTANTLAGVSSNCGEEFQFRLYGSDTNTCKGWVVAGGNRVFYTVGMGFATASTVVKWNYSLQGSTTSVPSASDTPELYLDPANGAGQLDWMNVTWVRAATSAPNNVMPFLTLPPLAPMGLHVTNIGTTSISLAWTNPAGTVTNDSIAYGTSCSSLTSYVSTVGSATSGTATGVSEGVRYCLAVRAWNSTGGSVYSTTINATTNVSSVTALKVTATTTSTMSLKWSNPGSATVTNITATIGYTCAASFRSLSEGPVATATISTLPPGTTLCYGIEPWVGAKNGSFVYIDATTNATPGPSPGPSPGPGPTPLPCYPSPQCLVPSNESGLKTVVFGISEWAWLAIIGIGAVLIMAVWLRSKDRGGPSFRKGGD